MESTPEEINFGCRLHLYNTTFQEILGFALECEKLGFDSVWVNDHLLPPSGLIEQSFLECWTTLAAIAGSTSRIRIGTLVTCSSFRHPSLLAKMSSTLDVISGGRFELGIGAGWYRDEYVSYGYDFPRPAVRIRQLEEAVQIIKKMWVEEKASFEGRYYSVRDALNYPKPIQKPHPPLWIGGEGEQLLLNVVAKYADGWNISSIPLDDYRRKVSVLEAHSKSVGRDPNTIRRSYVSDILIAGSPNDLEDMIAKRASARNLTAREYRERLRASIYGTPEQCLDVLHRYIQAGVSYFILIFPSMRNYEPLRLFAEEVMPKFK